MKIKKKLKNNLAYNSAFEDRNVLLILSSIFSKAIDDTYYLPASSLNQWFSPYLNFKESVNVLFINEQLNRTKISSSIALILGVYILKNKSLFFYFLHKNKFTARVNKLLLQFLLFFKRSLYLEFRLHVKQTRSEKQT